MRISGKTAVLILRVALEFFMGFIGIFVIEERLLKAVLIGCAVVVFLEGCFYFGKWATKAIDDMFTGR